MIDQHKESLKSKAQNDPKQSINKSIQGAPLVQISKPALLPSSGYQIKKQSLQVAPTVPLSLQSSLGGTVPLVRNSVKQVTDQTVKVGPSHEFPIRQQITKKCELSDSNHVSNRSQLSDTKEITKKSLQNMAIPNVLNEPIHKPSQPFSKGALIEKVRKQKSEQDVQALPSSMFCITEPLNKDSTRTVFIKDTLPAPPLPRNPAVVGYCSTNNPDVSCNLPVTVSAASLNSTKISQRDNLSGVGAAHRLTANDRTSPKSSTIGSYAGTVRIPNPNFGSGVTVSYQNANIPSFAHFPREYKSARFHQNKVGGANSSKRLSGRIPGVSQPGYRKRSTSFEVRCNMGSSRRLGHFDISRNGYMSKYSLKRQQADLDYDGTLDVNRALGRSVDNLSRDKYKFINGGQVHDSMNEGQVHDIINGGQVHNSSSQFSNGYKITRLTLDRGRLSPNKSQRSSPMSTNAFTLSRHKITSTHGHRHKLSVTSNRQSPASYNKFTSSSSKISPSKSPAPHNVRTPSLSVTNKLRHRKAALSSSLFASTKKRTYCIFYSRFGRCHRGGQCTFIHDPNRVSVCTRFVRGTCKIDDCPFLHTVSKDRMPTCSYFLRGLCSRGSDCVYLHVNVGTDAAVCEDFAQGCCALGEMCKKKHILVPCSDFARTGTCALGKHCKLLHRSKPKQSKSKQLGRRASLKSKEADTKRADVKLHTQNGTNRARNGSSSDDDINVPWKHRRLPSYIALNLSSDSPVGSTVNTYTDSPRGTTPNLFSTEFQNDQFDDKLEHVKPVENGRIVAQNIHPQLRPMSLTYSFQ